MTQNEREQKDKARKKKKQITTETDAGAEIDRLETVAEKGDPVGSGRGWQCEGGDGEGIGAENGTRV